MEDFALLGLQGLSEEACALRLLMKHGPREAIRRFTRMPELAQWPATSVLLALSTLIKHGAQLVDAPDDPDNTLAWARARFTAAGANPQASGADVADCFELLDLILTHPNVASNTCCPEETLHPTGARTPLAAAMAAAAVDQQEQQAAARPRAPVPGEEGWGSAPAADVRTVMRHVLRYAREEQRRVLPFHPHCASAALAAAAGAGPALRDVVHWMLAIGAHVDGVDLRDLRQLRRRRGRGTAGRREDARGGRGATAAASTGGRNGGGSSGTTAALTGAGSCPSGTIVATAKVAVERCDDAGSGAEDPADLQSHPVRCDSWDSASSASLLLDDDEVEDAVGDGVHTTTTTTVDSDGGPPSGRGPAVEVPALPLQRAGSEGGSCGCGGACGAGPLGGEARGKQGSEGSPRGVLQLEAVDVLMGNNSAEEEEEEGGHAAAAAAAPQVCGATSLASAASGEDHPTGGQVAGGDGGRGAWQEFSWLDLLPASLPESAGGVVVGLEAGEEGGCELAEEEEAEDDEEERESWLRPEEVERWVLCPLAEAAAAGDLYVVQLLLEVHGADPGAHGGLPERAARAAGHHRIARLIHRKAVALAIARGLPPPPYSGGEALEEGAYRYAFVNSAARQCVTFSDWVRGLLPSDPLAALKNALGGQGGMAPGLRGWRGGAAVGVEEATAARVWRGSGGGLVERAGMGLAVAGLAGLGWLAYASLAKGGGRGGGAAAAGCHGASAGMLQVGVAAVAALAAAGAAAAAGGGSGARDRSWSSWFP